MSYGNGQFVYEVSTIAVYATCGAGRFSLENRYGLHRKQRETGGLNHVRIAVHPVLFTCETEHVTTRSRIEPSRAMHDEEAAPCCTP